MEIYGNATDETPVVPYYEVLALPGETEPEFALLQPFAPLSKKNLAAMLVARQDGDKYGQLMTIEFPKDKLVYGPAQVEARISSDPVISSQLTLWAQAGSSVIRGNLLVVPINQSVVYFEPVYLQAEQNAIPQLTRVIVVYGDKVVMEPTLSEALSKIFGATIGGGTTTTVGGSTTTLPSTTGTTTTTLPTTTTTTTTPSTTTTTLSGTTRRFQGPDRAGQPVLPGGGRGTEERRLGGIRAPAPGARTSPGGFGGPAVEQAQADADGASDARGLRAAGGLSRDRPYARGVA
jgi:uncharacterized membrane protein (UPF0182 family)